MGRNPSYDDSDENNDFGEYDLIPGDNDYPSDEMNAPDAPSNLTRIPASGTVIPGSEPDIDLNDQRNLPIVLEPQKP